jgi:hypothetical protein
MSPQIGPGVRASGGRTGTKIVAGGFVVATIGFYKLAEYLAPEHSAPPHTSNKWIYTSPPEKMGFKVDQRPTNLFNRVQRREVLIQAAKGSKFGTGALSISLSNKMGKSIEIQVPKGTFFGNTASGVQPLIVSQDLSLQLNPGEEITLRLDAFCGVGAFRMPAQNDMRVTPLVLAVPDVMRSQAEMWRYLRPYYPSKAASADFGVRQPSPGPTSVLEPSELDAELYYRKNLGNFAEFEAKCNADKAATSQWLDHFGDARIGGTGSGTEQSSSTGVAVGNGSGEENNLPLSALLKAVTEAAFRVALESSGDGKRPQLGSGSGTPEVHAKAESTSKQIGPGSEKAK